MSEKFNIRYATKEDGKYMVKWLNDKEILDWFPMQDTKEIENSVNICMSYVPYNAVITAEIDNTPCGILCLYLQSFYKICHSSLFVLIVDKKYRDQKVGTRLLQKAFEIARENFKLEILNLDVYEGNPAINLYKRLGFKEFGRQKNFIKLPNGKYLYRIMMEKFL